MTTPFLGEVQIFAFNFAPRGWAFCNGATLQISQLSTLYALIGTQYGGNGTTTFQVPNLANRAVCSQGTGLGLTQRTMGETFGASSYTLQQTEMPSHTHQMQLFAGASTARSPAPSPDGSLTPGVAYEIFVSPATSNTTLDPTTVNTIGGSQSHENRQPFLALNFCMSLAGATPSFT